jgi:hypothetical protein
MLSAGERPQTYALDRAAIGTGNEQDITINKYGTVRKYQTSRMLRRVGTVISNPAWTYIL